MTTVELVTFPDDRIDRWLIRGELQSQPWEHRTPETGLAITSLGCVLNNWTRAKKPNRGAVLVDAYHRLSRDPDTTLGIDVSLISGEQWAGARGEPFVEGCPILAVKVISPSDTHADMTDAVHEYLDAGVALVWVVDPDFETVAVYRSDAEPVSFKPAARVDCRTAFARIQRPRG